MSASVGVYVATAIYLAIGWDTEEGLGFEWYSDLGMGPCRREQDYQRHAAVGCTTVHDNTFQSAVQSG